MIKFCNSCDKGGDIELHFTNKCDNKCVYCTAQQTNVENSNGVPNADSILKSLNTIKDPIQVAILGGEPCLYINELYDVVKRIKTETNKPVFISSSIPITCYNNKELFFKILDEVDNFNLSAQHYDNEIADKLRGTTSTYNRWEFYKEMSRYSDKISVSFNIVKGFLDNKESICRCIREFASIGYKKFQLNEIAHNDKFYIGFDKVFGVRLKSAYSYGCMSTLDNNLLGINNVEVILRRACFLATNMVNVTASDTLKAFVKIFRPAPNTYSISGNGKFNKMRFKSIKD